MLNRTCLACGKQYEHCGSCPNSAKFPAWKNIFDTEDCKVIFENVSDYIQGVITKDVAKDRISKCDLSVKYKDNIQKHIDDIMTEPKNEDTVENIDEDTVTSTVKTRKNKTKNKNSD